MKKHFSVRSILSLTLALAAVLLFCLPIAAQAEEAPPSLMVGAAIRDITPTIENGMLPIAGVGRTTLVDVVDPLHTRVIALSDGTNTALIVSNETGKGPYGPLFAQELADHVGLPLEAIFYTATHAHATPEITKEIDMSYITFEEGAEVDNMQKWGRLVYDQMMAAADEALANMQPAKVGIGYSESYVNVNRNARYTDENGNYYWGQGYGFDGFSDKTLAAIRFENAETGDPIAFIVNYAVHGVMMYANKCIDGETGVSADITGFVSTALESQNEGAVAVYLSGAAGDQNPIFGNEYFTPSIETGAKETTTQGSLDVLTWLGKINYFDTVQALRDIDEMKNEITLGWSYGSTTIPARKGGDFTIPMHVLRIGDIALAGFGGEMFNEIGVTAIEQSVMEDTLWVNHVWTHAEQATGYHSTDTITVEGGQGANRNYMPGYISDAVNELVNELVVDALY